MLKEFYINHKCGKELDIDIVIQEVINLAYYCNISPIRFIRKFYPNCSVKFDRAEKKVVVTK